MSAEQSTENTAPGRRSPLYAALLCLALVAAASFLPGIRVWGLNHLAFYSLPLRLAALALIAVAFVPAVARPAYAGLRHGVRWLSGGPGNRGTTTALAGGIIATGLFVTFMTATNLLGDGQLIAQSFQAAHEGNPTVVMRSPSAILYEESIAQGATFLYYWAGKWATNVFGQPGPLPGIRVFICILGGLLVFLILRMVRRSPLSDDLKAWLTVLGLFGTTMQLYFGYVENYAPLVFFLFVYVAVAFLVMHQSRPLWWAVLAWIAATYVHVSGLVFLPSLVFLCVWRLGRGRRRTVVKHLPAVLVVVMVIGAVAARFTDLSQFLLPLYDRKEQYGIFHPAHLADMVNEVFMLLPIIPVAAVLWWVGRREERRAGASDVKRQKGEWLAQPVEWAFVGLVLAGNFVYLFCFDAVIGMARDWDLFAMFIVGLVPWTLMALRRYMHFTGETSGTVARWAAPSLLIVAVLGLAWFGINASKWRTAERFEAILEYDKRHGSYAGENLAIFYYDNNRLDLAITAIENTYTTWRNPRHAVRVAMYYQEAGRVTEAIQLMYQVLERHAGYDKALSRLLTLLESSHRWDEITAVAREGVKYHPDQAVYYFYLGESLIREGNTAEGIAAFRQCLALRPPAAVREHINRAIATHGDGSAPTDPD